MHCVNAMGDRRWCASKGDALQISPPIRQTSPGGRHTSTELSLCCTNLQMRTVRCQTNLSCTFLSCTNLSVQIWVVQIWVVQIWVVQILVAQIWVAKICYAQMRRWAACTGRQICGLHILGAPAVLRLRPSKGILQPPLLPFQMHQSFSVQFQDVQTSSWDLNSQKTNENILGSNFLDPKLTQLSYL